MARRRRAKHRTLSKVEAAAAIEQWSALVQKVTYKLCPYTSGQDMGDVASAARMGVLKGVATYQPSKGMSLRSWVWLRVKAAIIDWMRSSRPHMRLWARGDRPGAPMVVLESDAWHEDDERIDDAPSQTVDRSDIVMDVRTAISMLRRPRDRIIANGVIMRGLALHEVGREIGVTESRVSQHMRRIRPLLARTLRDYAPRPQSNAGQGSRRLPERASRRRDGHA